jgi:hypothetical protein
MSDPNKLICGMSQDTAERYVTIRQEIDSMIERIHKAGYWLSDFDKVKPDGLCHTLSMVGVMIMHSTAVIHDYLENEFASKKFVMETLQHKHGKL